MKSLHPFVHFAEAAAAGVFILTLGVTSLGAQSSSTIEAGSLSRVSSPQVEVETWGQFGGPTRQFHSRSVWPAESPVEVWRRSLGSGNSGIVVGGDRVFTQYRESADGRVSEQETVIALDAEDGATIWQYRYSSPMLEGQEDYGGGKGPHATPALYQDSGDGPGEGDPTSLNLVTVSYAGLVHCFDARSGEVRWQKDLVAELGAEPVQFGFSASPLIVPATSSRPVSVVVQGAGRGGLHALRLSDGEVLWSSSGAAFSYGSPSLIEVSGAEPSAQLLYPAGNRILGIDPADGRTLWSRGLQEAGLTNIPTPIWIEEGLIAISGQGVGGTEMLRLSPTVDGIKVESIWRNRIEIKHGNWVRVGDYLYGGDKFLYALNWRTGKRAWVKRGFENVNLVVLRDGDLAVQTQDGRLRHLSVNDEGFETLEELELFDDGSWTPPTIVGDRLYARSRLEIVALRLVSSDQGQRP